MASSSSDLAKASLDAQSLTLVAERLGSPPAKSSPSKLKNYVILSRKDRAWTNKEDAVLLEAYSRLGNKWTAIATMLKGRTDNAVKNRHALLQRKKHGEMHGDKDSARKRSRTYSESQRTPYHMPLDQAAYIPPADFYSPRSAPQLPDAFSHQPLFSSYPFGTFVDPRPGYLRGPPMSPRTASMMGYGPGNSLRVHPADHMAAPGYTHAFDAAGVLDRQTDFRTRYSMQAYEYYHGQGTLGANGLFPSMEARPHLPQEDSTGQNM